MTLFLFYFPKAFLLNTISIPTATDIAISATLKIALKKVKCSPSQTTLIMYR